MRLRHFDWDDVEFPIKEIPPVSTVPSLGHLRADVEYGRAWEWNYRGIRAILSVETLANALQLLDDWNKNRHRREPMPDHVGRFFWSQTSAAEQAKQPLNTRTSGDTTTSDEAEH